MRIIGIDPGTSCGWAVLEDGERVASGVWDLKPRRHEGGGMRFLRLRTYLLELINPSEWPAAVAYEEVRYHRGVDAAQVYGGIVSVLTSTLEAMSIPYRGMPVKTIKRLATGKGNAPKDRMIEAAAKTFGVDVGDDEADALFIALALHREMN